MENKTIELKREELYEQVWSQPVTQLAKRYGLSDVGLAKICKKFKIPRPPRGYWQRIQSGQKVSLPTLPPLKQDKPPTIPIVNRQKPLGVSIPEAAEAEKMIAYEKQTENKIIVPAHATLSHPILLKCEQNLKRPYSNMFGTLEFKGRKNLPISVPPERFKRALILVQTLIKAFESRGWSFQLGSEDGGWTYFKIFGESIFFAIEERARRIENPRDDESKKSRKTDWVPSYDKYKYLPSGRLTLRITNYLHGPRKSWSDKSHQKVEEMLNSFIIGAIQVALLERERTIEREKERKKEEEKEALRREAEKRRLAELNRIKELENQVSNWNKSQQIRAFLNTVRENSIKHDGSISPGSKIDVWLKWAEDYADKIDPLRSEAFSLE